MSCNNGKESCYIVDYHVDRALIPLFIKTPNNIFSHGVSQYNKTSAYTMSFNDFEATEWMFQYKRTWTKVESQLFE